MKTFSARNTNSGEDAAEEKVIGAGAQMDDRNERTNQNITKEKNENGVCFFLLSCISVRQSVGKDGASAQKCNACFMCLK